MQHYAWVYTHRLDSTSAHVMGKVTMVTIILCQVASGHKQFVSKFNGKSNNGIPTFTQLRASERAMERVREKVRVTKSANLSSHGNANMWESKTIFEIIRTSFRLKSGTVPGKKTRRQRSRVKLSRYKHGLS